MGNYLNLQENRNYKDIIPPTPTVFISHFRNQGIDNGDYRSPLNENGVLGVNDFASQNYILYGSGGKDISLLDKNLIKVKVNSTLTDWQLYNPRIVLYVLKKTKTRNIASGTKQYKTNWVRVIHQDGAIGNRSTGNIAGNNISTATGSLNFPNRNALWQFNINSSFPERTQNLETILTEFQPNHYIKVCDGSVDGNGNPLNSEYGQNVFPITFENWNNNNNNIANYWGTHGIFKLFTNTKGGPRYRMKNCFMKFRVAIEIDNPLTYGNPNNGMNPTGGSSKTIMSDYSNIFMVYPKIGTFRDPNTGENARYYYRWELRVK